ncbi:hypothetical protein GCM10020331_100980 [Ectobacillus funiculus]
MIYLLLGSIIRFLSRSIDPPLTSVDQPIEEMGRQGIDLLIERIEGKEKNKEAGYIISESHFFRNSTKNPSNLTLVSNSIIRCCAKSEHAK